MKEFSRLASEQALEPSLQVALSQLRAGLGKNWEIAVLPQSSSARAVIQGDCSQGERDAQFELQLTAEPGVLAVGFVRVSPEGEGLGSEIINQIDLAAKAGGCHTLRAMYVTPAQAPFWVTNGFELQSTPQGEWYEKKCFVA